MKKIDIQKHEFVPKHVILNSQEKDEVLKKYNITPKQLPRILISDPVIKMIEAKEGDVIKITRISPTAGEAVYYRVVTKG